MPQPVRGIGANLSSALKASAAAAKAESERSLVISQNIANAETMPTTPGGEAYQRKTISFTTKADADGVDLVKVAKIDRDPIPATPLYMPEHPGANEKGYVNRPNVNVLVEMTDARHSNLNYKANMAAMQRVLGMTQEAINILK
jgi:flagellar basal-body rod protein FlgC